MNPVTPLLAVERLSKTFPGQRALADVALGVGAGEIVGLVGQNGSGKSTLIKVLAGYHAADPGAVVRFAGEQVDLRAPGAAWRRNLHFIHQDLGLVPTLDAVENLALGRGYRTGRLGRIRWRAERAHARALFDGFGVELDLRRPVSALSAAQRATIAIVRALQDWDGAHGVLVLDEPTAALPGPEVEQLFAAVRRVAQSGAGVVFVSHRLEEVLDLTDRLVVLRDGRVVADRPTAGTSHDELVTLIAGRAIEQLYVPPPPPRDDVAMTVDGLAGARLAGLSFRLHAGEVLGVAGLLGSGREELAGLLCGVHPPAAGSIVLDGVELGGSAVPERLDAGIALVPSDRQREGMVASFSVRENLTLADLRPVCRAGRIDRRRERADVAGWIERVELRPREPERPLAELSGGNQQKMVIARGLRTRPKVMVLDEPTQGVDVGAKAAIYALLAEAAAAGMGAVVCSSEPEELAGVCDRVLVLRDGRIACELSPAALSAHRIVAETLGPVSTGARTPEEAS